MTDTIIEKRNSLFVTSIPSIIHHNMYHLNAHYHTHIAIPTIKTSNLLNRRPKRRISLVAFSCSCPVMAELPTLYPLHRCKTIHLVRHAQGYHNVAGEKDYSAYMSYEFLDASLTPLGWKQVDCLHTHVQKSGIASRIELVVTSPLTRTMQTAVGVFGGGICLDGDTSTPLMIANAANSSCPAITSLNCPPVAAVEWCREHNGVHPCDKRKSISDYQPLFPAIDFSLVESNEDVLWKPDIREKEEDVAARGRKFLNWLLTRKEREIAVVSHSSFLIHTLRFFGKECDSVVRKEIQHPFANCELRSFIISDARAIGTPLPTTNFPGGIPSGADLPSDFEDTKECKIQV